MQNESKTRNFVLANNMSSMTNLKKVEKEQPKRILILPSSFLDNVAKQHIAEKEIFLFIQKQATLRGSDSVLYFILLQRMMLACIPPKFSIEFE